MIFAAQHEIARSAILEHMAMIEIFKEFTFEAAHQLGANVEPGHPYANIHGHSFKAEVYLRGEPGADTGWICDLA